MNLPFRANSFDGVWFSQAFEYVSPEYRYDTLKNIAEVLKNDGLIFINIAHVVGECELLHYLWSFIYWRVFKRKPMRLGDHIYYLELKHYKGWHYHSLIISRRIEKMLKKYYVIIDKRVFMKGYFAYYERLGIP